jgi:hypothetical protein
MARLDSGQQRDMNIAEYVIGRLVRIRKHKDIFYIRTRLLSINYDTMRKITRGLNLLIHHGDGSYVINGYELTVYSERVNKQIYKAERLQ